MEQRVSNERLASGLKNALRTEASGIESGPAAKNLRRFIEVSEDLRDTRASLAALQRERDGLRAAATVVSDNESIAHARSCGACNGIPCDCGLDALRSALASAPRTEAAPDLRALVERCVRAGVQLCRHYGVNYGFGITITEEVARVLAEWERERRDTLSEPGGDR